MRRKVGGTLRSRESFTRKCALSLMRTFLWMIFDWGIPLDTFVRQNDQIPSNFYQRCMRNGKFNIH